MSGLLKWVVKCLCFKHLVPKLKSFPEQTIDNFRANENYCNNLLGICHVCSLFSLLFLIKNGDAKNELFIGKNQ